MPFYERQPYIQPLYQTITEILNGDMRVPKFQRAGTQSTWSAEQRGDLLDSLYRGYPIGTILLWATDDKIQTFNKVGGYDIPESENSNDNMRLLLDGHQRLSSLVQILGAGLLPATKQHKEDVENWVFDLQDDSNIDSRDRFVLLKPGVLPTPSQIPLSVVLNRSHLNKWVRENESLTDQQIQETDNLRDRLREYNIPVTVLGADSLEEATVSFKRINSSGTDMSTFDMVAALAYGADFDPREKFTEAKDEYLGNFKYWSEVSNSDILRVCSGLISNDPSKINVELLAKSISTQSDLISQTYKNVRTAIRLLQEIGIAGPAALPYSWQLITLAIFIAKKKNNIDISSSHVKSVIQKWFWVTTYGEVFAGINSATYKRSFQALENMLDGGNYNAMERDLTRKVASVQRFDFRAARSKACVLNMARIYDDADAGKAHNALADGKSALHPLWKGGRRSNWFDLGFVIDGVELDTVRSLISRKVDAILPLTTEEITLLNKLGIPDQSYADLPELSTTRENELLQAEKEFVEQLGLEWVSDYNNPSSIAVSEW